VGAAVIMPAANAEAMNEHLNEISTQVVPGAHAVVVCDRAGRHQTGGRLLVPHNINLLPLPPYAPELNPMENAWEYLRGNKLSRLVWDGYDAIVTTCKEGWDFLINDPDRIRSIGHRDWACVNVWADWYYTEPPKQAEWPAAKNCSELLPPSFQPGRTNSE
jgi:hypothetical protein